MDPKKLFFDKRFNDVCVYCGDRADTRDHVPSRVLLDEPYPSDLAVVGACNLCNNKFSKDEPYFACLIECAIHGSTSPDFVAREKIKRLLSTKAHFGQEIERSRSTDENGNLTWVPDTNRVDAVVLKLSRGHAAYEFAEPCLDAPKVMTIKPLSMLTQQERLEFEGCGPVLQAWPEIGSRAFYNISIIDNQLSSDTEWNEVQPGRYKYLAFQGPTTVRIVLSEYLACEVIWD